MRMRNYKTVYVRSLVVAKNNHFEDVVVYSNPIETQMLIQPAGGKVNAEIYGLKLNYMLTAYCSKGLNIKENDVICYKVPKDADPDYKVVAIKERPRHTELTLESVVIPHE